MDSYGDLPRWRCHKVVRAAKIVAIDFGERLDLMPFGVAEVGAAWVANHKAEVGGYFVVYEDGYTSYSPAAAFENGYAPLVVLIDDDDAAEPLVVLTDADAAADLAGTPRPDNPTVTTGATA